MSLVKQIRSNRSNHCPFVSKEHEQLIKLLNNPTMPYEFIYHQISILKKKVERKFITGFFMFEVTAISLFNL